VLEGGAAGPFSRRLLDPHLERLRAALRQRPGAGESPTAANQTVTLLGNVEVDAVRFDDPLRGLVHASLSKLTRIHSPKGVGDTPVII